MALPRRRANSKVEAERKRLDVGFGTQATSTAARLVNPDGTFNVVRKGQTFWGWLNLYNRLITIKWYLFVGLVLSAYLTINLLFACIYYSLGEMQLVGPSSGVSYNKFWQAFFFSSQTITTVGYGHISPVGMASSVVATIESFLGLLLFAIITGLLYGRFSRPNPRIIFSTHAVIGPYLDTNALMVRMANERDNQLLNVHIEMILSRNENTPDGIRRRYYTLPLERNRVKFFPTTWTAVHPIQADSPLSGKTPQDLADSDTELLVSLEGIDDTYADAIFCSRSYLYPEWLWGYKFENILETVGKQYIVDLNKINQMKPLSLNTQEPNDSASEPETGR